MKEVHKKSIDPAVNQILGTAYRRQIPLIWERAETMQPQCGFGRLSICCSDCQDGPCRINPFSEGRQETNCGRNKQELISRSFLKKAADGGVALAKLLSQSGDTFGKEAIEELAISDDEMLIFQRSTEQLAKISRATTRVLERLCQTPAVASEQRPVTAVEVNLGVLKKEAVNIVFHGHVDANVVRGLQTAAKHVAKLVQFSAICGNELNEGFSLPVLTNYSSQEAPLLTGAVDLVVVGNQCVMPAFLAVAARQGVFAVEALLLKEKNDYEGALHKAIQSYQIRNGKEVVIPAVKEKAYIGYTAKNSRTIWENVMESHGAGSLKGVIYLGGCGTVANTQDSQFVTLATFFKKAGYLIITGGCAGIALAKAGMCGLDENRVGQEALLDPLPVLPIGSCHQAGEFLKIAALLQQAKVPVFSLFPEINHNKILATALAFAAAGIKTWLGYEAFFADDQLAGGSLFPLTEKIFSSGNLMDVESLGKQEG